MGNTFLTRRVGLLLLVAVVALGVFAVVAGTAAALPGYVHTTGMTCGSCHPGGNTAVVPTNAACQAAGCHTTFAPLTIAGNTKANGTCWGCHTPGQNVQSVKTASGCGASATGCHTTGTAAPHVGTTPTTCLNCHGTTVNAADPGTSPHHVAGVTAKPVLTVKLSASSVKVKKTIKSSGLAFPAALGKVTIQVQKKSGSKWAKVTSKTATPNASSAWSYSYKATKKGSFRMVATTPAVTGVSAGSVTSKTFKVK
jgi:hypothetical protein